MRTHSDRSTLAGVAFAFVLLGSATVVFLFAGALLAFHGWPALPGSSDSRPLIVASDLVRKATVPRIVVATAPRNPVVARSGGVARHVGVSAPRQPAVNGRPAPTTAPTSPQRPAPAGGGGSVRPIATLPSHADSGAVTIVQTVQHTAQTTVGALGATTQGVTAAGGHTVAAVGAAVAGVAGAVSPPLGQTVNGLGSAVGDTLTGAGRLLGGLLGAKPPAGG